MHQGRSESASSSYLQGAIRRGETRVPQHTVRTSNTYFIYLEMVFIEVDVSEYVVILS